MTKRGRERRCRELRRHAGVRRRRCGVGDGVRVLTLGGVDAAVVVAATSEVGVPASNDASTRSRRSRRTRRRASRRCRRSERPGCARDERRADGRRAGRARHRRRRRRRRRRELSGLCRRLCRPRRGAERRRDRQWCRDRRGGIRARGDLLRRTLDVVDRRDEHGARRRIDERLHAAGRRGRERIERARRGAPKAREPAIGPRRARARRASCWSSRQAPRSAPAVRVCICCIGWIVAPLIGPTSAPRKSPSTDRAMRSRGSARGLGQVAASSPRQVSGSDAVPRPAGSVRPARVRRWRVAAAELRGRDRASRRGRRCRRGHGRGPRASLRTPASAPRHRAGEEARPARIAVSSSLIAWTAWRGRALR